MASVFPIVLFCLLFQAVPATKMDLCELTNTTEITWANSSYNIMFTPGYYAPSMNYTVTISGLVSAMNVSLSASVDGYSFGYWEKDSENCSGILDLETMMTMYNWSSPENMTANVTFKAYVQNVTDFLRFDAMLLTMETPNPSVPPSSSMPYNSTSSMPYDPMSNTTNITSSYMTNNSTASYHTSTKYVAATTKNGSAAFQPLGAFAITLMALLLVTAKQLLL